jgi:hypothetical protein
MLDWNQVGVIPLFEAEDESGAVAPDRAVHAAVRAAPKGDKKTW